MAQEQSVSSTGSRRPIQTRDHLQRQDLRRRERTEQRRNSHWRRTAGTCRRRSCSSGVCAALESRRNHPSRRLDLPAPSPPTPSSLRTTLHLAGKEQHLPFRQRDALRTTPRSQQDSMDGYRDAPSSVVGEDVDAVDRPPVRRRSELREFAIRWRGTQSRGLLRRGRESRPFALPVKCPFSLSVKHSPVQSVHYPPPHSLHHPPVQPL